MKARQTFDRLKYVWSSTSLSRWVKLNIFATNVKSTRLYGCETWNAASRDSKKLQFFINQCLRRIMRIFWPQIYSLWSETQQHTIAYKIKIGKWNWIGHTYRRRQNDIIIYGFMQVIRRKGRPAHTWRRQVDIGVDGDIKSWDEIKPIVQDRARWYVFVEALCALKD